MKQFWEILRFSIKMTFKSFMGGYLIIVPIVMLLILRSFLPSVENTSFTVAVVNRGPYAVERELIDFIDRYLDIVEYETLEEVENKLRGPGSVEGLYKRDGRYISLMERKLESNTAFSVAAKMIRQFHYKKMKPDAEPISNFSYGVPVELSDRTEISPVATMGGAIFIVFMIILGGFLIGLSLVEDKEEGTERAIKVSPVSKVDYFFGKSVQAIIVMFIYTIIAISLLGLWGVNILQTYTVILAITPAILLIGLTIGAITKNETEAMGVGKMMSMIVILSIMGGILLPDMWQWIVYWSPYFWAYDILEEIFRESANWSEVLINIIIMLGTTGLYLFLLRKKFKKGLS